MAAPVPKTRKPRRWLRQARASGTASAGGWLSNHTSKLLMRVVPVMAPDQRPQANLDLRPPLAS